jgi:hypothetical protein
MADLPRIISLEFSALGRCGLPKWLLFFIRKRVPIQRKFRLSWFVFTSFFTTVAAITKKSIFRLLHSRPSGNPQALAHLAALTSHGDWPIDTHWPANERISIYEELTARNLLNYSLRLAMLY